MGAKISAENLRDVLVALDKALKGCECHYRISTCGAAALAGLGILVRDTDDLDVIEPKIDEVLKEAASKVSADFGLKASWLNNGPSGLAAELREDWRSNIEPIFVGKNISVYSISRRDHIFAKLWAQADRGTDMNDLLKLNPTDEELADCFELLKTKDANPHWESWITETINLVKKNLGRN